MLRIILPFIFFVFAFSSLASAKGKKHKKHHYVAVNTEKIIEPKGAIFQFKGGNSFDFRSVKKDAIVRHSFQFTNTGDKTLYIDNVTTNCPGAYTKWDVEPILPGMKGHIYVTVDARELKGEFNKELYILSNAKYQMQEKRATLFISGNVETESYKLHDNRIAGW